MPAGTDKTIGGTDSNGPKNDATTHAKKAQLLVTFSDHHS